MKTFDDLVFEKHSYSGRQARMDFKNGFGISVLLGTAWYSNGINTYEVGILRNGSLCCGTCLDDCGGVTGHRTKEEINEIMRYLQELPADIVFEKDTDEEECDCSEQNHEEECDSPVESCEEEERAGSRNYVLDLEILVDEEATRKLEQMENRVKNSFLKAKAYGLLPDALAGIMPKLACAGITIRDEEKCDVQIMYLHSHTNKLVVLQNLAKELIDRIQGSITAE